MGCGVVLPSPGHPLPRGQGFVFPQGSFGPTKPGQVLWWREECGPLSGRPSHRCKATLSRVTDTGGTQVSPRVLTGILPGWDLDPCLSICPGVSAGHLHWHPGPTAAGGSAWLRCARPPLWSRRRVCRRPLHPRPTVPVPVPSASLLTSRQMRAPRGPVCDLLPTTPWYLVPP